MKKKKSFALEVRSIGKKKWAGYVDGRRIGGDWDSPSLAMTMAQDYALTKTYRDAGLISGR